MKFGPTKRTLRPGEPCCNGHSVVPPGAVVLRYLEVFASDGGLFGWLTEWQGAWWLRGGPRPLGPWSLSKAKKAAAKILRKG